MWVSANSSVPCISECRPCTGAKVRVRIDAKASCAQGAHGSIQVGVHPRIPLLHCAQQQSTQVLEHHNKRRTGIIKAKFWNVRQVLHV